MSLIAPRHSADSTDLKAFYEEHGWVSVKDLIPLKLLAQCVDDIRAIIDPYMDFDSLDEAITHLDSTDKQHLYQLHMGANKLVSLKAVTAIFDSFLKKLNGSNRPVIEISIGFLLGLPRDLRLAYDFHQESNFMKGFGEISNFHFPLRLPSTIENGTMSVLDRSHKLGTLPFKKSKASENSFTDLVPLDIEEILKAHEEIHCYLDPGDVTIFHKDCIHKSNFNSSDQCRLVGVSRLTQDYHYSWQRQTSDEL